MPDTAQRGSEQRLVGPLETVIFEGGLQATLQEDGSLIICAAARGTRGLVVHPRSNNTIGITVVRNRPNDKPSNRGSENE